MKDDEPPVPEGSLFTKKYKGDRDGLGKFKRDFKKIMKFESLAGITLGNMFDLSRMMKVIHPSTDAFPTANSERLNT